jgi:nitronate monooxygenase
MGRQILAAQAMGADLAYIGTRFIATAEANAAPAYKDMLVGSKAADIVYTPYFTGVHGNYLKPSIAAQGLDPDALPQADKAKMNFGSTHVRAWRDIWGAGQGVGGIATSARGRGHRADEAGNTMEAKAALSAG